MPDQSASRARLVLEGVPRVAFWPKQNTSSPQDDLLPGCLQAYLRFVKDEADYDRLHDEPGDKWHHVHDYLMGTSGHVFRLLWTDDWDFGPNTSFPAISEDPLEPVRRAFASIGYSYEVLFRSDFAKGWQPQPPISDDEAAYRAKIIASLQKGRPVLAVGVVGPPEPCLITGYDEGGEVLLGWNAFQEDPVESAGVEIEEPSGYFRKRDWFRNTHGLLLVGEPAARRPQLQIYREALTWGLSIMRAAKIQGRHAGQAAYQAWIEGLLKDDEFKALDEQALQARFDMHRHTAGSLAEARAWGGPFLRQIITLAPETKADLEAAISCFDAEHDLVWAIWEFTNPREGQTSLQRFADPWTRRRIVPLIKLVKGKDAEAAGHIERALGKMK